MTESSELKHVEKDVPDPPDLGQDKAILSLDNLGIFASIACLIHCLAMPVIIATVPFLGFNLSFLQEEWVENVLIILIVGFAIFAIVPGYFRHKKPIALVGLTLGLLFLGAVAFGRGTLVTDKSELVLIAVGNLILVLTHLLNRKLTTGSFLGHVHNNPNLADHSQCDHKH
ncbi:MAG: MerC domain-containing protein [Candidatus Obscuribacter sp.]|nr:MerC domain-containing protein [Candidatus Obscuribacter sp.]MBK9622548.1 MerC domain-containing protein [Candidatus Obscuribacter sp.]MBP6352058.1 MerC domain-containing protein [Candidatus Obscuribacter sp.]